MSSAPPSSFPDSVAEAMPARLSKLEEDLKRGEDTTMIQRERRGLEVVNPTWNFDGEGHYHHQFYRGTQRGLQDHYLIAPNTGL